MFKNIFISFKNRILLGFCSLIIMMAVIIYVSLDQFSTVQQNTAELNSTIMPFAIAVEGMVVDVIQVQQFLTDVSATHDPEGYKDAEDAAADFKKRVKEILAFESITSSQKDELAKLDAAFDQFYNQGKLMASAYIGQGIQAGNAIMEDFDAASLSLADLTRKFKSDAVNKQIQTTTDLSSATKHASRLLIGISILVVTLSLGIAFYLANYLYKQLGIDPFYAKAIAKEIAQGNFKRDINLDEGDKSSLLYAIKTIQTSINAFVAAQTVMSQKHAEGWIWAEIDAAQFPGTYGKMARDINALTKSHIDVKMQVVKVITQYAKGDFSLDMDRLPGDKAKITEAVDNVKKTLFEVSSEIDALAEAGSKGDFSKRADTSRFEFMFKDILTDFNTLIETCDIGFKDILSVTNAMAQGDMTQVIDKHYPGTFGEVITGMNITGEHLKSLVSEIKEATENINTAAKEIASGNNDLSHRTEEQAASLEETAASMEELTSTVQANSESAKQANQLAKSAEEIADKGVTVVGKVVTTMDSINASSHKIVDIISVIDGIAFQTNILALNAAVEAARAGEQGRGFAVVASEVRNLAQRAATAAGEIKGLIADSVEKVEDGSKLVTQAGHTMREIVSSIHHVTAIMSEISAASVEQSSGITQVNQAIAQMDDVTQQNAALVEQAAAAAESMEDQAQNLAATVAVFKTGADSLSPAINRIKQKAIPVKIETYKGNRTTSVPENKSIHNVKEISMDLDVALHKHAEWKVKFRTAISHNEKLDVVTISKDNCCDFGKWLHGNTKLHLGHLESFSECISKHAAFHVEAGKVAQAINDKRHQEANTMLDTDSDFIAASSAVGVAIMRLKKDVALSTKPVVAKHQPMAVANGEWEEF
ncbi:methyl-accepting chemotaxis protein [Methylobacter sp.]|uniref:methyl-accepting chemotaxis protein n=1 Tax=Methylobacter sp. TaxID=2051955 RepID=UPI0024874DC3|nr:methyl-accepting chemotaxis protein [Methylobacter sp.]MDI1276522.1 methyl-accepting chemotaxis protein [Methylobacter sp.]MDI1357250.1 methyl-accepting chemotaxis protein [Methylobacter sp.]